MPVPIEIDDDEEVKADMTPMIDVIFLLLVFFILTTKFVVVEKVISSLLPTDKGQSASTPTVVEQLDDVNICIYPNGLTRGGQPSFYDGWWNDHVRSGRAEARMRIGRDGGIVINGFNLSAKDMNKSMSEVQAITDYVSTHLRGKEQAGTRQDQAAVIIHCFSGLPWKYAVAAYDAVRSYEMTAPNSQSASSIGGLIDPNSLLSAREVDFAPPRIRNYHTWALGNELYEIIHMQ